MKTRGFKFILLGILGVLPIMGFSQESDEVFQLANQAYFQNQPKQAVSLYQSLLQSGYQSGDLLYNLGNAHYRLGKIGDAILAYEKAMRLIPRDADLRANLAFVEKKRLDPPITEGLWASIMDKLFFWSGYWTLEEGLIAFVAFFSVGWLFGVIYLWTQNLLARKFQMAFLLISVVLGASSCFKNHQENTLSHVILLEPTVPAYPNFLDQQTVLLELHEGTKLKVHSREHFREEGAWLQVGIGGGRKGWIRSTTAGEI